MRLVRHKSAIDLYHYEEEEELLREVNANSAPPHQVYSGINYLRDKSNLLADDESKKEETRCTTVVKRAEKQT